LGYGIDLKAFERRWSGDKRNFLLDAFKNELIPQLASCVSQIGVKEIRHKRWRELFRHFPEMKILLIGRADAQRNFDLMPDYCRFWEYEK